ncbi:MAG: outer membrane protein assembly factor BamE domain-containing protein [Janthinobacterium lividum]
MYSRIIFFISLLVLGSFSSCNHSYSADNELLTEKNIKSIQLGMTEEQVESIIGEPVKKIYGNGSYYTFQYTQPSEIPVYTMVWVHFGPTLKVHSVYVKDYFFLDDQGIYSLP